MSLKVKHLDFKDVPSCFPQKPNPMRPSVSTQSPEQPESDSAIWPNRSVTVLNASLLATSLLCSFPVSIECLNVSSLVFYGI